MTNAEDRKIIMEKNLFRTLCPNLVRKAVEILDEMIDEELC